MERRISIVPIVAQVLPIGVGSAYQVNFLLPQPTLDGFLFGNSGMNIAKRFKIDQLVDIIFFRKAGNKLVFMLIKPLFYVVGHAHIKRSGLVGHNVNVVLISSLHSLLIIALNSSLDQRFFAALRMT